MYNVRVLFVTRQFTLGIILFCFPKCQYRCPRTDIGVSSRIKLDVKMIDRNARRSPNKAKTSARKGVVISSSARLRNDDTGKEGLCEAASCKTR